MTQKTINLGTADQGNGDPIRVAFGKVNDNFTELYTALGLNVGGLNLGAFEFTGSTMSTTDSTAIIIDQATTITSNLSVGGDIVPQTANGGDLGSSTLPWRSLYVSNNTIYIGGTAVGVDANGNLTTGGTVVGSTPTWDSITGKPTFAAVATSGAYYDLTGRPTSFNSLVTGAYSVNLEAGGVLRANVLGIVSDNQLTIEGATLMQIQTLDGPYVSLFNQGATKEINLVAWDGDPLGSSPTWTFDTDRTLTLPNDSSIKSATNIDIIIDTPDSSIFNWRFGADGALTFPANGNITVAVGNFVNVNSNNVDVENINGLASQINFTVGGNNNLVIENNLVTIQNVSLSVAGDITLGGDIRSEGNINIDINLSDSTLRRWQFGEDGVLNVPGNISQQGSPGLTIGSSHTVYIVGDQGDNNRTWTFDGTSGDTELPNGTVIADDGSNGIEIVNGVNGAAWTFGTDGSLTIPGDIRSEGNINIDINLSDSTLRRWQFGEDGNLTFPDGTNYSGKDITLPQTTNGTPNKVSWNFSDIAVGSTTTFLEWNLLSTDLGEFLIGTSSAATPFYFSFDGSGQTLGTIDNGGIVGGGKLTFGSTAGSNAGDVNAIELKATNGDVYLTSTESVKITVDASDSSARVWTFDPSGNLNVPGGIVAEYEEDFTISTSYLLMSSPAPGSPVTNTFTFAANGDLTVPELILGTTDLTLRAAAGQTTSIEAGVGGSIEIGYQADPPANIYIGTGTIGPSTTTTNIQSDRLRVLVNAPTTSKGQSGDIIGLVAFSSTHIYYCTASYDGTTDIWKRVALTGGVW